MEEKEYNRTIHILVGLPGSGKTTWASSYMKSYKEKNSKQGRYGRSYCNKMIKTIQCDNYLDKKYQESNHIKINNIEDLLKIAERYDSYIKYNELIVDGLFLNTKSISDVITYLIDDYQEEFHPYYKLNLTVKIHHWIPNIELCIHNDIGRRDTNSSITIKNAKIDYSIDKLKEKFPGVSFEVITHNVVKATEWDKFNAKYGRDAYGEEKEYITSDSWSNGGSWGNCWGDEGTISPDEPKEFDILDDILQEVFPEITYLQYKELNKKYIEIEEWSENDYYGGTEYHSRWRIKVKDLYNFLVEKGKIKED